MSTRPGKTTITAAQAWDSPLNDNLAVLFDGPMPVYEAPTYADLIANFAAASHVNCIACTEDTEEYWHSDGSNWLLLGSRHPNGNGARQREVVVVQTVDLTGQASPYTVAAVAPAGTRRKWHSGRLIQAATGTSLTSLDLGDGTDADRFANDLALALNTTFTPAQATADPAGWSAAAHDFVVTGNGLAGNFTAGQIRLVTVYEQLTAPTS